MVDTLSELLVATGSEKRSGHVSTTPVEGVLVVSGLVDHLGPDLLEGLGIPLGVDTEVELVADLEVDGGLDDDFLLVVVVGVDLK